MLTARPNNIPVSVIIPCYRCTQTIERALLSIENQTFSPIEVLLIEDASNDNGKTADSLNDFKKLFAGRLNIVVVILPVNNGPGTARNIGWEKAKGEYIAFLDSDDSWHPQKLEIQYSWMIAHPEVALSGHQTAIFNDQLNTADFLNKTIPESIITRKKILMTNPFPTRSVMVKTQILFRFEHGKRRAEDYLLWLTIILNNYKAYKLELPLAYSYKSDFGEGGLSSDLWKMEKGELDAFKKIYQNNLINSLQFLTSAVVSYLKFLRRVIIKFNP